ncbi:MAG: hypothetical protein DI565_16785 [Ancylobacter novellus]|uniref:Calcineurin-like phosphoesterase domain-containing protein n=1 Tax=Ancylobacter novellus TaxID=921 RepID=A0A2W5K437_ANCNO|nr:MAG: hypothetical protein DI565_16785 [Ancylobacter novellus]
MPGSATFLHLTDVHFADAGADFVRDDFKVSLSAIGNSTRREALDLALVRLAETLEAGNRTLDGVLFSGDALHKGSPGGQAILRDMLLERLAPVGIRPDNVVVSPGNHDVLRDSRPSSRERYEAFIDAWRGAGCITPWLDGVDEGNPASGPHCLVADGGGWAVFPINSSNWSQSKTEMPEPLAHHWAGIPALLAGMDPCVAAELAEQLADLARYDVARISPRQMEMVRTLISTTRQPTAGRQVRIAVMHHHLRSPGLGEEFRPFAEVSNLEQVRHFLHHRGIAMVVHGHKHEGAVHYDHMDDADGNPTERMLVVSGTALEGRDETNGMRLLVLGGLPGAPSVTIESVAIPRGGLDPTLPAPIKRRLWFQRRVPGSPVVVQGSDLDEVYDRACEAAAGEAANGILVIHLDLPPLTRDDLPLPSSYPVPHKMNAAERRGWLRELVSWWQLGRSVIEHRMPFVHGTRLRRYGGKIDQVARIVELLRHKPSTRAVAVLVDPFRDFTPTAQDEEFASFCLVQFKRRDQPRSPTVIDAIAFYRAQEFARWWPINVAELRHLQWDICKALGFLPGRITTIAADARTHSRSPTQVAMPVIDRWLDQAPERIYVLADALARRSAVSDAHCESLRGWRISLSDLEAAAREYNPDGWPVAIEGLRLLAACLEAVAEVDDPNLAGMANALRRLSRHNEAFESGERSKAQFDRWAPDALEAVDELRHLTDKRLPQDGPGEIF